MALRNLGIALSSVGIASIVGGVILLGSAWSHGESYALAGAGTGLGGAVLLGVGLALWIDNGRPKRPAHTAMIPLVAPGPGGFALTWKMP